MFEWMIPYALVPTVYMHKYNYTQGMQPPFLITHALTIPHENTRNREATVWWLPYTSTSTFTYLHMQIAFVCAKVSLYINFVSFGIYKYVPRSIQTKKKACFQRSLLRKPKINRTHIVQKTKYCNVIFYILWNPSYYVHYIHKYDDAGVLFVQVKYVPMYNINPGIYFSVNAAVLIITPSCKWTFTLGILHQVTSVLCKQYIELLILMPTCF